MKTKGILIFAFLGVFVLGVIAGGALVSRWGRALVERKAVTTNVSQQWRRLSSELNLTSEQRQKIRQILSASIQERQEILSQGRKVDRSLEEKIAAELTPEQQARFKELRGRGKEREKRWQNWLREQRKGDREPPAFRDDIKKPTPVQESAL